MFSSVKIYDILNRQKARNRILPGQLKACGLIVSQIIIKGNEEHK